MLCFGFCLGCEANLGLGDKNSGSSGDLPGEGTGKYAEGEVPDDATCDDVGTDVGANVLRRLSRVEYQLTLQDLFKLPEPPSIDLIPEDVEQDGFTSIAEVQTVTAQHLRAYLDTAGALHDDLLADGARYQSVVGCDPTQLSCVQAFIASFGRLAFRRDLTEEEVSLLESASAEHAIDAADQVRYAMEALLISPHFLFRVEVGDSMEGLSALAPGELAAKLSFTLFGRGPSAELLDRAEAGELESRADLEKVLAEMLADPRAQAYYKQFFRQWLGYAKLRPPIEPPADWSDDLMPEMTAETDALIEEHAFLANADFFDVLTANHTTVTPALASFYGITPDQTGRYEFPGGDPREGAGVLGHAAVLSQKTDGDKISVRGNWLRNTFLCEEIHIPPSLAETLGEALVGLTSLEIIEKRNTEAECSGCHQAIDPIGVGLAQFDASGRFDASVDLAVYPVPPAFPDADDPEFSNLGELSSKLRAMPALAGCLAERVFIYAHGRHTAGEDACAFEGASEGFTGDGNSFSALVRGLVLADGFRLRRAPTPTTP